MQRIVKVEDLEDLKFYWIRYKKSKAIELAVCIDDNRCKYFMVETNIEIGTDERYGRCSESLKHHEVIGPIPISKISDVEFQQCIDKE